MNSPHSQPRFLRLNEVERIAGLKKSKLYQLIQQQQFPRPYKLGRSSRWSSDEVFLWMHETCRH